MFVVNLLDVNAILLMFIFNICAPVIKPIKNVYVRYNNFIIYTKKFFLVFRSLPKIYIEPNPPFKVEPGGNLNITCSAVGYPFPQIYWQR